MVQTFYTVLSLPSILITEIYYANGAEISTCVFIEAFLEKQEASFSRIAKNNFVQKVSQVAIVPLINPMLRLQRRSTLPQTYNAHQYKVVVNCSRTFWC